MTMHRERMVTRSPFAVVVCICIALFLTAAFAADESKKQSSEANLSFIGKIKIDNVNIRAGGNKNFEILAKVNSNDLVFVEEKSYGWYKVRLPKAAYCYVWKDFIERNDAIGISKVSNLNLRARPSKESSVIGQLKKADTVTIVNEDADGWYQVNPTQNCYGWIHMDLVEYYSSVPSVALQGLQSTATEGRLVKFGFTFKKKPGTHKLIKGDEVIYYIKSDVCNLKDFEGKAVCVWGNSAQDDYDKPLMNVERIEIAKP